MYSSGTSVYKICKLLNRSETSVKNHLKKLGIFVPTEVDTLNLIRKILMFVMVYNFYSTYVLTPSSNPVEIF